MPSLSLIDFFATDLAVRESCMSSLKFISLNVNDAALSSILPSGRCTGSFSSLLHPVRNVAVSKINAAVNVFVFIV